MTVKAGRPPAGWMRLAGSMTRCSRLGPAAKRQTTRQSTSAAEVRAALRFAGTHGYLHERTGQAQVKIPQTGGRRQRAAVDTARATRNLSHSPRQNIHSGAGSRDRPRDKITTPNGGSARGSLARLSRRQRSYRQAFPRQDGSPGPHIYPGHVVPRMRASAAGSNLRAGAGLRAIASDMRGYRGGDNTAGSSGPGCGPTASSTPAACAPRSGSHPHMGALVSTCQHHCVS